MVRKDNAGWEPAFPTCLSTSNGSSLVTPGTHCNPRKPRTHGIPHVSVSEALELETWVPSCQGILLSFFFFWTLWNHRSFLPFLFQSTVSLLQPKLAPSFWCSHSSFLHARTTGMCHHVQLKGHAPLNHLSPAPSLSFFWKWFPSLGFDRLKY